MHGERMERGKEMEQKIFFFLVLNLVLSQLSQRT